MKCGCDVKLHSFFAVLLLLLSWIQIKSQNSLDQYRAAKSQCENEKQKVEDNTVRSRGKRLSWFGKHSIKWAVEPFITKLSFSIRHLDECANMCCLTMNKFSLCFQVNRRQDASLPISKGLWLYLYVCIFSGQNEHFLGYIRMCSIRDMLNYDRTAKIWQICWNTSRSFALHTGTAAKCDISHSTLNLPDGNHSLEVQD